MSALGHKRTFRSAIAMSTLPPKADTDRRLAYAWRCYNALHESRRNRRSNRQVTAFEAGRGDHAKELDSTATKLGRLAGRAFAELKKRGTES
jgi:hypothetical protein